MKFDKQYWLNAALAAPALVALSIPMLFTAAAIWLTSPGPAIFRQKRHGRGNKPFIIYKFRTMAQNEITPMGAHLRRWGVDELPQLWNIMKGEMAFIGPRALPHDGVRIPRSHPRRRVRPGITGLAQVRMKAREHQAHYNSSEATKIKLRYDKIYVKNCDNRRLKLEIIFQTFGIMLSARNDDLRAPVRQLRARPDTPPQQAL